MLKNINIGTSLTMRVDWCRVWVMKRGKGKNNEI